MSILRISGGRALKGEARVQGAKNSVLPIIAAAILASGETVIHNCPDIADVGSAARILKHLGCTAKREGGSLIVNTSSLSRADVPDTLMREMRSSVIFMGALLARTGEAVISTPGGCELGRRPIDLHISALRSLGADVEETGSDIICRAGTKKLRGAEINLKSPSVGATENAMLAASAAEGTTVITNAAREPEIEDLQTFMRTLGINVRGAGSPTVVIEGARVKPGAEHGVIPDRIAAATYLAATAAAGGEVTLTEVIPRHLAPVTAALREMGCTLDIKRDRIHIMARETLKALKPIATEPYPGFPTDAQPQMMAACLKARGTTVFVENIFENRYRHAEELRRFGADIKVEGRVAIITGTEKLTGASVAATDLRGGAALVIAGLSAEGVTEVSDVTYIDRGYENIEAVLRGMGADAERIETAER